MDYTTFSLRVNINVDFANVYQAITTSNGFERWFLKSAVFCDENGTQRDREALIQKGDHYKFSWFGFCDTDQKEGVVLEANGVDHFRFSFSLDAPVDLRLTTEENETILTLIVSELPYDGININKHFILDLQGWMFYLINLKSILEGGLDLRNRNFLIEDVITA